MSGLVSVLITVFNGEAYLAEAMDSVLGQEGCDLELVVVDNGSTDRSAALAEDAAAEDQRVRVVRLGRNMGRTRALERGLAEAKGEYLAILDADDACLPGRLARQRAELEARPRLALVGCRCQLMDEAGSVTGELAPPAGFEALLAILPYSNPLAHSGVMYRTAVARTAGGYPRDYPYSHDMELYLAMIEAGYEVDVLPEQLVRIREHGGQVTACPSHEFARRHDMARTFLRASSLPGIPAASRSKGLRAFMYCEMRCVRAQWLQNKSRAASRLAANLLRHPWLTMRAFAVNPDLRAPLPREC